MRSAQDGNLENRPPPTTNASAATTTSQTIRKPHSSKPSPLVPLELLQHHRRGSLTDPHLHAIHKRRDKDILSPHATTNPLLGAAVMSGADKGHDQGLQVAASGDGSRRAKRKASGDMNPPLTGPGITPPTKRRREEGWQWKSESEGDGGGSGGNGAGDAGTHAGGQSNHATLAWLTTSPGQAAQIMQDPHDPNNVQSHIHPMDPNNQHPQLSMMSSIAFANDRRIPGADNLANTEPASGPSRSLRSRSRPPSRQHHAGEDPNMSGPSSIDNADDMSAPSPGGTRRDSSGATPYSRSPELRVSHKLAERKRRKEMKDLFDELRDQLPADRGMKASKWEILSKAIDFVAQLKQSHQDMAREMDMMRHELDSVRGGGVPSFGPGGPPHPGVYGQPPLVGQQYPPGAMPHPPQHPLSRPPSSQNSFPPGGGPSQQAPAPQQPPPPQQNGNGSTHHAEPSPT